MTFDEYIASLPAPVSPLFREAMKEGWLAGRRSQEGEIARAVEAEVIKKIKAQGEVAWLHRQRTDSDVVTTAVKHVWGNVAVGSLAAYDIPLYRLPEGD